MKQVTFDFTGKNFVVTGASSGIGRQIAIELAAAGANVLAIARREKELQQLKILYQGIMPVALDVCDEEKLEAAIKAFVSQCGKIDGAVHAAGVVGLTPLKMYDKFLVDAIFETSLWSGVSLLQICTKVKISNLEASFVLFSSTGSYNSAKGMFAYASAKGALRIATKCFAKEISSRRLRVNTVSPGWVNTDMTDKLSETNDIDDIKKNHLLGIGNPEDVSGMVLFLLSDRAKWITGTDVIVDGGYLA